MDMKEFLYRNYAATIQATGSSPQALAAANAAEKWISAQSLSEDNNRSSRSPEDTKASHSILRPVDGNKTGTPYRRRRVESTPNSPASSVNFRKNPHLRPPIPSMPFTPDKFANGDGNGTPANGYLRVNDSSSPSFPRTSSPTPSLGRKSEGYATSKRRASSSFDPSPHRLLASTPRSSLIAEASQDQM